MKYEITTVLICNIVLTYFSISGGICFVCLIVSLIFAQRAGNYVFTLFDNFSGSIPLLIIALCECIAISYCYGLRR